METQIGDANFQTLGNPPKKSPSFSNPQKTCRNCGGQHPHKTVCPASGKTCNYCKKPNHFKTVCNKLKRKQQVKVVSDDKSAETDSDDTDDYCYTINTETEVTNTVKQPLPQVSLKLC